MHSTSPLRYSTHLPWWLAGLAAVALMIISVSAWRGADAQQQAAEAAVVKFATSLAEAKVREFSQALARELAISPKIQLQWFSVPGEADDWIFGPWPQSESEQWTASELPKETLKKRAAFEATKTPEAAKELAEAVLQHPSALTAAFLEEAGTVLPEYNPQAAAFANLRSVLRQHRADVVQGKHWLGKNHYAVPNQATGQLQVISVEAISTLKQQLSESTPHERERIFQPFYRIGSELRRETPGIGIGLALVKETAEAHAGRVEAVEAAGGGAEFLINPSKQLR